MAKCSCILLKGIAKLPIAYCPRVPAYCKGLPYCGRRPLLYCLIAVADHCHIAHCFLPNCGHRPLPYCGRRPLPYCGRRPLLYCHIAYCLIVVADHCFIAYCHIAHRLLPYCGRRPLPYCYLPSQSYQTFKGLLTYLFLAI